MHLQCTCTFPCTHIWKKFTRILFQQTKCWGKCRKHGTLIGKFFHLMWVEWFMGSFFFSFWFFFTLKPDFRRMLQAALFHNKQNFYSSTNCEFSLIIFTTTLLFKKGKTIFPRNFLQFFLKNRKIAFLWLLS